jgi:hypothetical protein
VRPINDDDYEAVYEAGKLVFCAIYGIDPADDYDLTDREVDERQQQGYKVIYALQQLGYLNDQALHPGAVKAFAKEKYTEPKLISR